MGGSQSVSVSDQEANAFLSQQYYGSCDIECKNIVTGLNIDIINTILTGGINLDQQCTVNGQCMMGSSSDATADVLFKALNSSNAKNASSLFSGDIFNFDEAVSMSRQDIKETIMQQTSEKCNMSSLNQMSDVSILAANSRIGGGINIGQTGAVSGQCQLQNNMTAASTATALASNTAQSGKDKKAQKKGSDNAIWTIFIFIAAIAVIFIIAKMFTGSERQSLGESAMLAAAEARAAAGCPGGLSPVINKLTGKPVIDPTTGGPICPPYSAPRTA